MSVYYPNMSKAAVLREIQIVINRTNEELKTDLFFSILGERTEKDIISVIDSLTLQLQHAKIAMTDGRN